MPRRALVVNTNFLPVARERSRVFGIPKNDNNSQLVDSQWQRLTMHAVKKRFVGHVCARAQREIGWFSPEGMIGNRNRRRTSPALIARKLMLLDYVLETPAADWYATEQDKVALFTTRFGVPTCDLPHRIYIGHFRRAPMTTTRHFVHKLPIALLTGDAAVVFVFLVTDTTGRSFAQFIRDHLRLLGHLPAWRIVAVAPQHIPGLPACETSLRQVASEHEPRRSPREVEDLKSCFGLRERTDCGESLADLTVAELDYYREFRHRFSPAAFEELFERWRAMGDAAFEPATSGSLETAIAEGRGRLVFHRLPVRYDRFGTRAGVA